MLSAVAVVVALAGSRPLEAQSFFAGKTVRIVVGLAPGGGFDTYARLLARHLGRLALRKHDETAAARHLEAAIAASARATASS